MNKKILLMIFFFIWFIYPICLISQTIYYVDPNIGDDAYNGLSLTRGTGLNGPKKHIQNAITDAASSSTIMIAGGTYTERLTLNKPLTLQAVTGNTVILQPSAVSGATLTITEAGSGSKIIDHIIIKSGGTLIDNPVVVTTFTKNVTIQYCTINSTGSIDEGISFNGTYDNITIKNNTFLFDDFDVALNFNPSTTQDSIASNISILNNTFTASGSGHVAIAFAALQIANISNNTFGSQVQFNVTNQNSSYITTNYNTFTPTNPSASRTGGILVQLVGACTGVLTSLSCNYNDFLGNNYSVVFDASLTATSVYESGIAFGHNNLNDNTYGVAPSVGFAVNYSPDSLITATDNYWKNDNGPSHINNTFNISNQGEKVSNNVNFAPWLKTSKSGTSFSPVSNGTGGKYSSIQLGITNTAANGTLTIVGGLFTENIIIPNGKYITINGNGYKIADSTTVIGANAGPTITINNLVGSSTNKVTISGFNIKSKNSLSTDYPLQINDGSTYITIKNCKINSLGLVSKGIALSGTYDNIVIGTSTEDNLFLFDENGNDVAINFDPIIIDVATNITVTNNTFSANGSNHYAMKIGALQSSSLTYNTFGSAVYLYRETNPTKYITFSYNNFIPTSPSSYNTGGLFISQQNTIGTLSGLTISYNKFQKNNFGIVFDQFLDSTNVCESTIHINYNEFFNNTFGTAPNNKSLVVAISPAADSTIDAKNNYWSNNNGPVATGNLFNVGNQGEAITDYCEFVPWLMNSMYGMTFSPVSVSYVPTKYYASIQNAVAASTSHYKTVTVQPGTYKELVTITQALVLNGYHNGIDPTLISGEVVRPGGESIIECENLRNGIVISANNVTVNGLTIQNPINYGININKGSSLDSCNIKFNRIIHNTTGNSATGIQFSRLANFYFKLLDISYNLIKGLGSSLNGNGGIILQGRADYDIDSSIAISVTYNKIMNSFGNGILLNVSKGSTVSYNILKDNQNNTNGNAGISISYSNNSLIKGNTFITSYTPTGDYYGIYLNEVKNCDIQNNDINGTGGRITKGIYLTNSNLSSLLTTNNRISNNYIKYCLEGFRQDGTSSKVLSNYINNNEISGNTTYGVNNLVSNSLDATLNYWGSNNGPIHSTNTFNIGSQGDRISDSVVYIPWRITSMTGASFIQPPVLLSPATNVSGLGVIPTLRWTKVTSGAQYQLQIATDSQFAGLTINSLLSDTTYTPTGLNGLQTYYWRVYVSRSGVNSNWSSNYNFRIGAKPPTLLSPAYGTLQNLLPTFSWYISSGANSYGIQLSTDSLVWSSPVINVSGIITNSYTVISNLNNNTKYYWKVNSTNALGTSEWSNILSFSTVMAVPSLPMNSLPINQATNQNIRPTFKWNSSQRATSYIFQISSSPYDFSTPLINQSGLTDTTYTPVISLANNTTYYWQVAATNNGGTSSYSTMYSFTTIVAAPNPPVALSPTNNATNVQLSTSISWGNILGITSYRFQLSPYQTFSVLLKDTNTSYYSVNMSGLSPSSTYYWRVNATNIGGTSAWSTIWNFSTVPLAPSAIQLYNPTNQSSGVSITRALEWYPSSTSTFFQVQVSSKSDFTAIVFDSSNISRQYANTSGLSYATTYYWRVRGSNAGGVGPWSNTWSYSTEIVPPQPVTLLVPSDGSSGRSVNPTFQWYPSPLAISYKLQISKSNSFSPLIKDSSGIISTTAFVAGLNGHTVYYWRICGVNSAGIGQWSQAWSFSTINRMPNDFKLKKPISGEMVNLTFPKKEIAFSWNPSLDPDGDILNYTLTVTGPGIGERRFTNIFNPLISVDIMSDLMVSQTYQWYVDVTDGFDIVRSDYGTFQTSSKITKVSELNNPDAYALMQNYPNPFNPTTSFSINLPKDDDVTIEIFNVYGSKVKTISNSKRLSSGSYNYSWDSRDDVGNFVSSGTYFVKFITPNYFEIRKIILSK